MINNKSKATELISSESKGYLKEYLRIVRKEQLLDEELWAKFVLQFQNKTDTDDMGWRGEFWGKVMRGACSVYSYAPCKKLYSVLTNTVKALLALENNGNISSYSKETEFTGWDLWGRKYVLVGLLYYYNICKNQKLRNRILKVVDKNVFYIIKHIGNGEEQKGILEATHIWGGANVSTIIVPFMDYFNICHKKEVLDFVGYVVNEGFSSCGNIINAVKAGLKPNDYPVTKAYELTSCFEGLFEYAKVTDNQEYMELCFKYFKSLADNELTVTGCLGCWIEVFSNGAKTQTNAIEVEHQETCVTVTWLGFLYRLLTFTGESVYADYMEQSVVNNLYGSINTNNQKMKRSKHKTITENNGNKLLVFDSYSPLYYNYRGSEFGGNKPLDKETTYGCCTSIGSFGLGIYGNANILKSENKYLFNLFAEGKYVTKDFTVIQKGNVFKSNQFSLRFKNVNGEVTIGIRMPRWSTKHVIKVNDNEAHCDIVDGYAIIQNIKTGDVIQITYDSTVETLRLNGKIAFRKGAVVLARDESYNDNIKEPIVESKNYAFKKIRSNAYKAKLSYRITDKKGKSFIVSDYSSVGKNWDNPNSMISVWLDVK